MDSGTNPSRSGATYRKDEAGIEMAYTIEDHKHRLAAWAASRAASASKGHRFKVCQGIDILEACGFTPGLSRPRLLPISAEMDHAHEQWRQAIIEAAEGHGLEFTHGVAAKLINSYLKVRFVCGGFEADPRVKSLHPPIDRVLLEELAKSNFGGFKEQWKMFCQEGWSNFGSDTYETVIDCIRDSLPSGEALWKIEEHWKGHQ